MRALILAAGQGTRLRPLTNDRPKCMVELAGKPLLRHQVDAMRHEGIDDIHVVGGYLVDRLDAADLTVHVNPDYATTNMVYTMFNARDVFDGTQDVIICYGDIVFRPAVLRALLACDGALCLTADRDWLKYWSARMDDPLSDAETFRMDADGNVVELGNRPDGLDTVQAQYMGLFKVSADRAAAFLAAWDTMQSAIDASAETVNNIYMTAFIQGLIDAGWTVPAVLVNNGWMEVDAASDLELVDAGFWSPLS